MRQFTSCVSLSRSLSLLFLSSLILAPAAIVHGDLKATAAAAQYSVCLNSEAGWGLNAELNHCDGMYKIGDKLELRFSSPTKDAHVHLFSIGPDGKICLIWPNDYHPENKVKQGETVQFPTPGSNLAFRVQAPVGKELLVLLATERPLNLRDAEESRKLAEFLELAKTRQAPLAQLRSFIVEQEKTFGWAGKAIEITTRANGEVSTGAKTQDYLPPAGCFSVQGIGEFKQTELKNGGLSHLCQKGSTIYMVTHFPIAQESAEQMKLGLDRVREGLKKDLGGIVLSEQSLVLPDGQGFELQVRHRIDDRERITLSRTLRIGNRLYLITVSDIENSFNKSTADMFMQSFKAVATPTQLTGA